MAPLAIRWAPRPPATWGPPLDEAQRADVRVRALLHEARVRERLTRRYAQRRAHFFGLRPSAVRDEVLAMRAAIAQVAPEAIEDAVREELEGASKAERVRVAVAVELECRTTCAGRRHALECEVALRLRDPATGAAVYDSIEAFLAKTPAGKWALVEGLLEATTPARELMTVIEGLTAAEPPGRK